VGKEADNRTIDLSMGDAERGRGEDEGEPTPNWTCSVSHYNQPFSSGGFLRCRERRNWGRKELGPMSVGKACRWPDQRAGWEGDPYFPFREKKVNP